MLIIGRKRDQKIVISDNIVITILEIGRNRVRFGIEAPKEVPIHTRQQSLVEPEAEPKPKTQEKVATGTRPPGKVATVRKA